MLLEKVSAMRDQNLTKDLEPSVCISRAFEVPGTKQTRELSFERGSIVLKNPDDKLSSVTGSELKLHFSFIRRGIALEFA